MGVPKGFTEAIARGKVREMLMVKAIHGLPKGGAIKLRGSGVDPRVVKAWLEAVRKLRPGDGITIDVDGVLIPADPLPDPGAGDTD